MSAPVKEGDVLAGKYRVDRVLGVGGMGVVVAATHTQLDEKVALKFMLPAGMADKESMGRFQREARAAVKLKSEHVARVLDVGTLETGAPYIVMEFLSGCDLAEEVRRRGPLPLPDVAEYVVHACDALAEAHALGIVHRDLKPANLFLTRRADGSPLVKVLDFGISKASALGDANLAMTATTAMMGSPLYMSPEQMRSSKDVDGRTDVWALGVILYELAAGRVPFDATSIGELMARVMMEPPPPIESVRPDVPPAFVALVTSCLAKDRDARCPSVGHVAAALAPFAPPRARPIAERAAAVLGAGAGAPPVSALAATSAAAADPALAAASAQGGQGPHGAQGTPSVRGAVPALPALPDAVAASATAPNWGVTGARPPGGGGGRLLLIGAGVVVLAGLGVGLAVYRKDPATNASPPQAESPSAAAAVASTAAGAVPPAPASAPAPPPIASEAASPVASAAGASTAVPSIRPKLAVAPTPAAKPATSAPAPHAPSAAPNAAPAPAPAASGKLDPKLDNSY